MATIKQLTAWIESNKSKLVKKQDLLAKYETRRDKALAELQKSKFWDFDKCCACGGMFNPYTAHNILTDLPNALDIAYKYNNASCGAIGTEKAIRELKSAIECHTKELERRQAEAAAEAEKYDSQLEGILKKKLELNREQFIVHNRQSAENEIKNAPVNKALAEQRIQTLKEKERYYYRMDSYKRDCAIATHCGYLMKVDDKEYIAKAGQQAAEYYDACVRNMTKKLSEFQINKDAMVIRHERVTDNLGINMLITDGSSREIDARLIWAAEYSDFVSAHLRFIVTQRVRK